MDWDKEIGLELVIGGYSVTLGVWETFWEGEIWKVGFGDRNDGENTDVGSGCDGGGEGDWFECVIGGSPQ